MSNWRNPIPVSDARMVFPANVIGELLPTIDELAEVQGDLHYWRFWMTAADALYRFLSGIDKALPDNIEIMLKLGVDSLSANRHMGAVAGSFEPSHEHKIAGMAFLLEQWFEPVPPKQTRVPSLVTNNQVCP